MKDALNCENNDAERIYTDFDFQDMFSTQPTDVMGPGYEDDIVNIDTEETEREVVINIDDSCDTEAVLESLEIQKLDEGSKNKSSVSSDLEENTALLDCDVFALRKLLKESEEKLKNRRMKIRQLVSSYRDGYKCIYE